MSSPAPWLFVALSLWLPCCAWADTPPTQGAPALSAQTPARETPFEKKARRLWERLSATDKATIQQFFREHNLNLLLPDPLVLRRWGRNDEAIKLLVKQYRLEPARAAIILDLYAYANGQD